MNHTAEAQVALFRSLLEATTEEFRSENKEFLANLHNFFGCREQLKRKYQRLDPEQMLTHINFPSRSTTSYFMYTPVVRQRQHRQVSIQGTQVQTMKDLYDAASIAKPHFEVMINAIVEMANTVLSRDKGRGNIVNEIIEKANSIFPGSRGKRKHKMIRAEFPPLQLVEPRHDKPYSELFNVVRANILCPTAEAILDVLMLFESLPCTKIVHSHNRFASPSPGGYRNFAFCLEIITQHCFTHVCEVQIHLTGLRELHLKLDSERYYEYFVRFQERLNDLREVHNKETKSDEEERDLTPITESPDDSREINEETDFDEETRNLLSSTDESMDYVDLMADTLLDCESWGARSTSTQLDTVVCT